MSAIPTDLKYTESHEWIRVLEDGSVIVGITDHAQAALGDLVFVEVPEAGTVFSAGDACAVVESVKAASDVYCPLSGKVDEANDVLADTPELVNEQPYEDGWLMRISPSDPGELDELMSADDYTAKTEND